MTGAPASRTRPISPNAARLSLALLVLLLLAGLRVPVHQQRVIKEGEGDVGLFTAVVDRVRQGEPYYPVMGSELRQRGYPTASVFNWRTPFPIVAVARHPRATAIVFYAIGALTLIGTVILMPREPPEVLLVALLAQVGVTVSLLKEPRYALMAEAWAGFLITLSVVAYGRARPLTGAVLGSLALVARELAAPYCAACGLMALRARRWREAALWCAGGILYLAYLALHVWNVSAQLGAHEVPHRQGWIQFGGLPFLLRIISFIGWYDALPVWGRAVGCVVLAACLWNPAAPKHLRAAVVAFAAFFAVVGQPFNQYWGLVTAPAFAVATGYGVGGLWRLVTAAVRRP